ncbi:MAG: HAD-IA family hydrolase [Notoacmeibacter sp.]|nr:HAD-IA family hydrolase [Notoacmeibacter sp.]
MTEAAARVVAPVKLVLFDCDGTLVDSAPLIHACMERTFAEAGFVVPAFEATKSVIGLSLDVAIARLLSRASDEAVVALTARYKQHFSGMRGEAVHLERLYDGIGDLIATLGARDDVILGMVTGKSRRGVESVFARHGFGAYFHVIRTADDCPSKPHPAMVLECCAETGIDPSASFVIGDAIFDMQMARAAGATAIGVDWGYAPAEALTANGAHHIVSAAGAIAGLIG